MTMEQSRKLAALEKRLDAMEETHLRDREVIVRALSRQAEAISRLREAVATLERESVTMEWVLELEKDREAAR